MDPIQEWLGLDIDDPNYYQLLGLAEFEENIRKIEIAADRAMAKVRSHRPGPHAALWADLLDQLADAKRLLTDPQQRARYDCHVTSRTAAGERLGQPAKHPELVRDDRDLNQLGAEPRRPPVSADPRFASVSPQLPIESEKAIEPAVDAWESEDAGPPVNPFVQTPPSTTEESCPFDSHRLGDDAQLPAEVPPAAQRYGDFDTADQPVPYFPPTEPTPPMSGLPPKSGLLPRSGLTTSGQTETGLSEPAQPHSANLPSQAAAARTRSDTLLPILLGVTAGLIVLMVFGVSQSMTPRPSSARSGTNSNKQTGLVHPPVEHSAAASPPGSQAEPNRTAGLSQQVNEPLARILGTPDTRQIPLDRRPKDSARGDVNPQSEQATDRMPVESTRDSQPVAATRAEDLALREALTAVRREMTARKFGEVASRFATAQSLAKSPEHRAMVRRLQKLNEHVMEFHTIVQQAVASLDAGTEIRISESTVVSVVGMEGNILTLFVAGRHKRFQLDDLSPGLAMALVAQSLGQDNPRLPLLKGAYLAVHERTTEEELDTIRGWWNTASLSNPVAKELLAALDDGYELVDRD